MHLNLLSLKIHHKLLFYYIQIQKFMPFNKGFFYSHPIRTFYEAVACDENPWYVSKQQWKAVLMWAPGTQRHIPGRAGEVRSPYPGKFIPVSERKNNSMIYYPIAVQCYYNSKPRENRGLVSRGKIKSTFLSSFSSRSAFFLSSFQPQGLGTSPGVPSQPGRDTCPAQELSPCQGWLQPARPHWFLELRVQGTDPPLHIYFASFHSPSYVTCRENALVAVNMVMHSLIWLEIIVTLTIFQVRLGQK